jgi:hypothetical protein
MRRGVCGGGFVRLLTRQGGPIAKVNVIGIGMSVGCTNTLNNSGAATTGYIIADTVF